MAPKKAAPKSAGPVEEVAVPVEEGAVPVEKMVVDEPLQAEVPKKKVTKKAKKTESSDQEMVADSSDGVVNSDAPVNSDSEATGDKKKRIVNGCVSMEIVKQVAAAIPDVDMSQKNIKLILDTFVKTVIENCKSGTNVTLTNYMTFKRSERQERTHKVPNSDKTVVKPKHYVLTIDVKPALKKQFEEIVVDAPVEPTS